MRMQDSFYIGIESSSSFSSPGGDSTFPGNDGYAYAITGRRASRRARIMPSNSLQLDCFRNLITYTLGDGTPRPQLPRTLQTPGPSVCTTLLNLPRLLTLHLLTGVYQVAVTYARR